MPASIYSFIGGDNGEWEILQTNIINGPPIPIANYMNIKNGDVSVLNNVNGWIFKGVVSNLRYTTQDEKMDLVSKQPSLNRVEAKLGAMILIKKNEKWWDMSQDERRKIFEKQSEHIQTGIKYLPAIARRLHHSRDLLQPFDFITWFEFSEENETYFNELVNELRKTPEWEFVDREIDVRTKRVS